MISLQQVYEIIEPNVDYDGLIVNIAEQHGGGDTAQREGMFYYALATAFPNEATLEAKLVFDKLEIEFGKFVRHPGQGPEWYRDVKDFSRDQTIPLVIAMGALKDSLRLKRHIDVALKNWFRAQNGDILWAPHHIAMYLRAYHLAESKPVSCLSRVMIYLGDVSMIFASLFCVVYAYLNPHHSDDLNHTMLLLQSQDVSPTWFGKLACRIYSAWRPSIKGTVETWGPLSAMEAYFSPSFTPCGPPRIDRIYNLTGIMRRLEVH